MSEEKGKKEKRKPKQSSPKLSHPPIQSSQEETEPPGVKNVPSPPLTEGKLSSGACLYPSDDIATTAEVAPAKPSPHKGSSITSSPHLSGSDLFPPPRPPPQDIYPGEYIKSLKINFFELTIHNESIIHQYRVDIIQDMDKIEDRVVVQKHVCESVWRALVNKYTEIHYPVYDGRATLYTRELLWKGKPREFNIEWADKEDGDKIRIHKVRITHTGEVDLSQLQIFVDRNNPYETADTRQNEFDSARSAIQVLEVMLSQRPKSLYHTIGRNHYFEPKNPKYLGQGCDMWKGYFQSLRPGQSKPFVNVDVTFAAMIEDRNLVDFVCHLTNSDYPEDALKGDNLNEVRSQLCGLKVYTRHMGYPRVYKLSNEKQKVLGRSSLDHTFKLPDGSETNTCDYFYNKYNIELKYPRLQLVAVGSRGSIMLPMELCTIVKGQPRKGKLTPYQTSEIIKSSAMVPYRRMKEIEYTAETDLIATDLLDHYRVKIDRRMYETEGRVLKTPIVKYSNEDIVPKNGSWNLKGVQFKIGMTMDKWVIVDFVNFYDEKLNYFIGELISVGKKSGIIIEKPSCVISPNLKSADNYRTIIEQDFNTLHEKYKPIMFMVFLNEKPYPLPNKEMYKLVKRLCDHQLGVLSQCVKSNNIFNPKTGTLANICLKINAKLGGVNHTIDTSNTSFAEVFKSPVMFIGADVNHPPVGMDETMPSIAAAVGSIDSRLDGYASCVRFQKHSRAVESKSQVFGAPKRKERLEIIDKFDEMCHHLISAFSNNCGTLPDKIIYYRDGVSEGQFREVLNKELKLLKKACKRISADYKPAVTIVCVQKRHHMKMFCKVDGSNVPPGCVVDEGVTHPVEFDFYLCSHKGIQGTSRPTHYHVLWDENKFNSNSLQSLTYNLCHVYARCTKAVSIPAPVYYAHWVAYRAMITGNFEGDTSSVGRGEQTNWEERRMSVRIKDGLMYWA